MYHLNSQYLETLSNDQLYALKGNTLRALSDPKLLPTRKIALIRLVSAINMELKIRISKTSIEFVLRQIP